MGLKNGNCKSETYEIYVSVRPIYRYELSKFTTKVRPTDYDT